MSNNILVITSNPEKDSMTDAVGAAFAAGAVERGASADVLDLYDEGFNPVYSAADRAHYLGHAPMPEDVVPIQRRLAQADVIALVFPIYWYTMPAMVKGLFDRVICRGFAYHPDGTPGALADKTVRVIMLTGGSRQWYEFRRHRRVVGQSDLPADLRQVLRGEGRRAGVRRQPVHGRRFVRQA